LVNEAMKDALRKLRPQMVPLSELMISPDTTPTAIGNYHGDIYEQLFDFAKNSQLNKLSSPPGYEKYIRPIILSNGDNGQFKL
jgi:hypothetical protein